MTKTGIAAFALVAATFTGPAAQAADVLLNWTSPHTLDLTAQITTPNGCYFSEGAKLGPPDDFPDIKNALVITLAVGAKGDVCPQEITVLDYHLSVPNVPEDTTSVIVYETWPQAQTVKATSFPLPPHKK